MKVHFDKHLGPLFAVFYLSFPLHYDKHPNPFGLMKYHERLYGKKK